VVIFLSVTSENWNRAILTSESPVIFWNLHIIDLDVPFYRIWRFDQSLKLVSFQIFLTIYDYNLLGIRCKSHSQNSFLKFQLGFRKTWIKVVNLEYFVLTQCHYVLVIITHLQKQYLTRMISRQTTDFTCWELRLTVFAVPHTLFYQIAKLFIAQWRLQLLTFWSCQLGDLEFLF